MLKNFKFFVSYAREEIVCVKFSKMVGVVTASIEFFFLKALLLVSSF